MLNFITGVYTLVKLIVLLFIIYVVLHVAGVVGPPAKTELRATQKDLGELVNKNVEDSLRSTAKDLKELAEAKYLKIPGPDPALDTVTNGDVFTKVDQGVTNFIGLVVADDLPDVGSVYVGRVYRPAQSELPLGFKSAHPVAFFVGASTDDKHVKLEHYMLADCSVKLQKESHHSFIRENDLWIPVFNAYTNLDFGVAHQACWMAYPSMVEVQEFVDY